VQGDVAVEDFTLVLPAVAHDPEVELGQVVGEAGRLQEHERRLVVRLLGEEAAVVEALEDGEPFLERAEPLVLFQFVELTLGRVDEPDFLDAHVRQDLVPGRSLQSQQLSLGHRVPPWLASVFCNTPLPMLPNLV